MDAVGRWLEALGLGTGPWPRAVVLVIAAAAAGQVAALAVAALLRRGLRSRGVGAGPRIALLARRPVLLLVALGAVIAVTPSLGLGTGPERLVAGLLQTVLIGTWVAFAVRASRAVLDWQSGLDPAPAWAREGTATLFGNLLVVVLALAGAYAVLLAWGVNVTGLVASAGILGLALSFAAQDTLANLFAGVAILTDQPYRIGDYIVLDSGERGRVTRIGLRSTRLLTRDDEEVSIPNGVIARAKIVNESGGPYARYRIRVRVGVAYGSDLDRVSAALLGVAAAHGQVCREPEPRVRLRAFGDFRLEFELLAWIEEPALRGLVLHELNCDVYRAFAREGISIPVPQQEVRLRDRGPAEGGARYHPAGELGPEGRD